MHPLGGGEVGNRNQFDDHWAFLTIYQGGIGLATILGGSGGGKRGGEAGGGGSGGGGGSYPRLKMKGCSSYILGVKSCRLVALRVLKSKMTAVTINAVLFSVLNRKI